MITNLWASPNRSSVLRTGYAKSELLNTKPPLEIFLQILLRQEYHDQSARKTLRLQIRLPRANGRLPGPKSEFVFGDGAVQVPARQRARKPVPGSNSFFVEFDSSYIVVPDTSIVLDHFGCRHSPIQSAPRVSRHQVSAVFWYLRATHRLRKYVQHPKPQPQA